MGGDCLSAPRTIDSINHIGDYTLSGSVDILVTTVKIRDGRCSGIVVCYRGRRCNGRNWTPAFCPHRPAGRQGGAPALPKPFQRLRSSVLGTDPGSVPYTPKALFTEEEFEFVFESWDSLQYSPLSIREFWNSRNRLTDGAPQRL